MVKRKKIILLIIGLVGVLLAVGTAVFGLAIYSPRVVSSQPASDASAVPLDNQIVIQFDKPVDRSLLIPSLTPDVSGQWVYEDQWLGRHLFKRLRFQADRVFDPNTTYVVELKNITDIGQWAPAAHYMYRFHTKALPDISTVTPAADTASVSPKSQIVLALSDERPAEATFEYILEPAAPFHVEEAADRRTITLTPDQPLAQGTSYRLYVNRTFVVRSRMTDDIEYQAEPVPVWNETFAIAPPPIVAAVSPTGVGVAVTQPITITFDSPMNADSIRSHFSIEPSTVGTMNLSEDGLTLTFQSTGPLAFDTAYTATIGAGTETVSGGTLPEAAVVKFTTIGPVSVTHINPADGATGADVHSSVHLTFNQAVDHASAEAAFAIDPGVSGTLHWTENVMQFTPTAALDFNTTYRFSLAGGVKSIAGQDSQREFSYAFRTAPQTVKLAVAIDFQDKPLSCEAAALKMALAVKGVQVSENDIMANIPVNSAARQGKIWGDPYREFVGNINGRQNTTGYGVYWDPIAHAAGTWRSAEAFTGWSIPQLTREVAQGNAVVVWGVYAGGYQDDWQTNDGKHILAWKGEHARTLIGFVGSPDDPSQLILNDPVAGQLVWTKAKFQADFAKFGNAGVVVR